MTKRDNNTNHPGNLVCGIPFYRLCSRQGGDALIIFVVFIVALFAMGALSIDVGNAQLQRKKMHEATDAAALAAVPEWWTTKNTNIVFNVAKAFAEENGFASDIDVTPGRWEEKTFHPFDWAKSWEQQFAVKDGVVPLPAVKVTATRKVKMLFAQVVGFTEMNPAVESVAIVTLDSDCAVPFAACEDIIKEPCGSTVLLYTQNKDVSLNDEILESCKEGSGSNFGLLRFPSDNQGGNSVQDNIAECSSTTLSINDQVDTFPGQTWKNVQDGLNTRIGDYNCAELPSNPDDLPDADDPGDPPALPEDALEALCNAACETACYDADRLTCELEFRKSSCGERSTKFSCDLDQPLPRYNSRVVVVPKVSQYDTGTDKVTIEGFYVMKLYGWVSLGKQHKVFGQLLKTYDYQSVTPIPLPLEGSLKFGAVLVK